MTAIEAVASAIGAPALTPHTASVDPQEASATTPSFGNMLMQSLQGAENRIDMANDLVRRFTLDDSVPVHEVTVALEQARIAVELTLQVRTHLIEGYRQIINMQL